MAENVVHSIVARRVINKSENLAICPSDDIVTSQILNKQFSLMTSYYMSFAGREKLVFSHLFLLLYPSSSTKEFLVAIVPRPRLPCLPPLPAVGSYEEKRKN